MTQKKQRLIPVFLPFFAQQQGRTIFQHSLLITFLSSFSYHIFMRLKTVWNDPLLLRKFSLASFLNLAIVALSYFSRGLKSATKLVAKNKMIFL